MLGPFHNYKTTLFRDNVKVTYSKLGLSSFSKKEKRQIAKEIKQRKNNFSNCVKKFKEKFAYNFHDFKNVYFCTLTIATYDNPHVPDTKIAPKITLGGAPFSVERQKYSNASDIEGANEQWHLFVKRLIHTYNLDTKKFKGAVVAELQGDKYVSCKSKKCYLEHKIIRKNRQHFRKGRNVGHFHFVANKFLSGS